MKKKLLAVCSLAPALLWAQLPDTDIYLIDMTQKKGKFTLGKPLNITARPGYDNQPYFLSDNKTLLYASIRTGQADIYSYSLMDSSTRQVTNTPESEYSPTETLDGKYFSTVRVEKDSAQRLWKFPLGGGHPELVYDMDSVGYHCWITEHRLAFFVLTTPFSLQMLDMKAGKTAVRATHVGRCILKVPGRNSISFVEKSEENAWVIRELNINDNSIVTLIKTMPEREDYVWTNDGTLLMGHDGKLYKFRPGFDDTWQAVADLSGAVGDFMRIAISRDGKRLAVVSQKKP